MTIPFAQFPILLVFGLLTSGVGCQVLPIPSYRADRGICEAAGETYYGVPPVQAGVIPPENTSFDTCPTGFFPPCPTWSAAGWPVPKWWANWQARRSLPDPAPYPRFHPLPTRPMFQPPTPVEPIAQNTTFGWNAPLAPTPAHNYGQLTK